MAITIDWSTFTINIPRNDLTLIQSTPTEIREMDLNWFRLQLKDIEDSTSGMVFPDTHKHNTEVSLGGVTYARIIEILDPYTITFEDGLYAVNLIGANSNVGDKVNVNQVSIRSNNSAGLISTPLIEYGAFGGGVTYDEVNGSEGTLFPIGTPMKPAKLLSDIKLIANYRGFNTVFVVGEGHLNDTIDFSGFIFVGQTYVKNKLTISTTTNVINGVFRNLTITGILDGSNELINCIVEDMNYVSGYINNSGLIGNINLSGLNDAIIINCNTIHPLDYPIIDMGGFGQNLTMTNYAGNIKITNLTQNNLINIGLSSGEIILDSTSITSGIIHVSGTGLLVDESGNIIESGTWNGGVTIINNLVNSENISTAVWNKTLP